MIHESIYRLFRNNPRLGRSIQIGPGISFLFAPGVVLLMVGIAALLAPRLFVALISGLFLFVGAVFCLAAWKILKLKRSMDSFLKTQVYVQRAPNPVERFTLKVEEEEPSERKITFH